MGMEEGEMEADGEQVGNGGPSEDPPGDLQTQVRSEGGEEVQELLSIIQAAAESSIGQQVTQRHCLSKKRNNR